MKFSLGKAMIAGGVFFLSGVAHAQEGEKSYCEPPQVNDAGQILDPMPDILATHGFDLGSLAEENAWMANINFTGADPDNYFK